MKMPKFPVVFTIMILTLLFIYNFCYLFPFTNNAFVVANIRPVAADVYGYITDIYIKNEQFVKKGSPLITVFKTPYSLAYQKCVSDVAKAKALLLALHQQVEKTEQLINAQQAVYNQMNYDYKHYALAAQQHAISIMKATKYHNKEQAAMSQLNALKKQLALDKQNIIIQKYKIQSLTAVMKQAQVNLDETTVYAKSDGFVQNMYLSLGTPVEIRQPLFSFIDTEQIYFQANFNETELKLVKPGDRVTIFPRMYLGNKIYHGRIVSRNWAVNRQMTDHRSQEQIVTSSENNWFLLPQRLPVQIELTDYDPVNYPLSIGTSAYVYIHTKLERRRTGRR